MFKPMKAEIDAHQQNYKHANSQNSHQLQPQTICETTAWKRRHEITVNPP